LEEQGIEDFSPHRQIKAQHTWFLWWPHQRGRCLRVVIVAVFQKRSVQRENTVKEAKACEHRQQPGPTEKVAGERCTGETGSIDE
jgi:hypothetical protein